VAAFADSGQAHRTVRGVVAMRRAIEISRRVAPTRLTYVTMRDTRAHSAMRDD
jgi:hypothetical protein